MIGLKGRMNVIDNSGGLIAECINVLKAKSAQGMATVGDEIVVVINKARPISQAANSPSSSAAASASNIQKVRRGDVRRAVIVRTRFPVGRPDGRNVRFDDNACVLLNNKGEMIGTRVNGVVAAELRDIQGGPAGSGGRWGKVLGLAGKVV
ncbi:54S ribosomal protein L38, mitochondrial [Naganishia albida]|nr:54S ribosomal protein L38, mitochondrial [Naganishia albida]